MATPFRLKRSAVSGKRPGLSDLQKGELALNFYDGHLYATRDTAGVGIGTTVSNLTPWKENFNNTTIHYENNVGIGTTNASEKLTIDGNLKLIRANDNAGLTRHLTIEGSRGSSSGVTAFGKLIFNNVDANSGATAYDAVKLEAETTGNNGGELVFFTTPNSSTTAEEAVRINDNGKVGIGTNTPTASLEIHSVTNGANSPFKVLHSPGSEYFRISHDGKVGIGITNPSSIVHISDTNPAVRITDENQAADNKSWNISAGNSNRLRIQALNDSNVGGASFFDFYRTDTSIDEFRGVKSGNTWFVISNVNRRVGIGSSVPTAKLDVDGTVNVTGVSTFSDEVSFGSTTTFGTASQNIQIYNGNTIRETGSGEFRILGHKMVFRNSNDTKTFAEFVNGGGAFLYFNNSEKFRTTGYGVTVFGGVNVSGVSTFSDEVSFGSTATFGTATQNIQIYTDSSGTPNSIIKETGNGNLRILGNKIVFKNTADNRVYAEFNNGGPIELYHDNSKKFETTGYGVTVFGGVNVTGVSTFSDDVQIGTGGTVATFDVSGGRLGIGIANPNTKLHIKGSGAPGIRLQDEDGTQQHATFIENNGQLFINSRNDTSRGVIAFRGDNGTDVEEFMRISAGGDIGIGTDNPGEKLHLKSSTDTTILIESDDANLNGNERQWEISQSASGGQGKGALIIGGRNGNDVLEPAISLYRRTNSNQVDQIRFRTREDDALTIKHDGKVGIGSTQPAVKLDVDGTINSHNDITINGTSVLSTAENDAVALAIALG